MQKQPRFDFTINIPTIVTVIVLAGTVVSWLRHQYESLDIFIAQHNVMWIDYQRNHPDAELHLKAGR